MTKEELGAQWLAEELERIETKLTPDTEPSCARDYVLGYMLGLAARAPDGPLRIARLYSKLWKR